MELSDIKSKIQIAVSFFEKQVHVSGKENSKNYAAGIEYLENLAASIILPPSEPEVKPNEGE